MGDVMHTSEKAAELRRGALDALTGHGHPGYDDDETRTACGACALEGFAETTDSGPLEPNYGGWERIYVQAGRAIPAKYREAFEDARASNKNTQYAINLGLDIATFGVQFED